MAGKVATEAKITEDNLKNVKQNSPQPALMDAETVKVMMQSAISETFKMMQPYLAQNNQAPQEVATTSDQVRGRVMRNMNNEFERVVQENNKFLRSLLNPSKEDKVYVTIPRVYKPYFGSMLPVGINTSIINVPIDNRPHPIHKAFLPIIMAKLGYEDEKISYMQATDFSDVSFTTRENLN